jgi:pimeloyl-ACP methyl ester carboxylesterase
MSAFRILRWGDDDLPPVVCLHDVRGHARRFERLAHMLEPGRLVVAYDLRGHGRSPWSGPQTLDQHSEDLDAVLEASGIDQTGLIGEGFGARIAIDFAVRSQERVTSLSLLDPPIAPRPALMYAAARGERSGGGYAGLDEAVERRRVEDGLMHTPRGLLEEEMAEHLVADEDGRYRYRYSREAAAQAFEAMAEPESRLSDVLCPTLVVHGVDSPLVTDADIAAFADAVRRLRVEEVPGGHAVLWDALAETSAYVRDFLVARRATA